MTKNITVSLYFIEANRYIIVFNSRALIMQTYKKYICVICGFIYDEAEGWPEDGIAPGTLWADVPENWFCPDCGAGKEDFEMVEMD